jgi:hypothetical protein
MAAAMHDGLAAEEVGDADAAESVSATQRANTQVAWP